MFTKKQPYQFKDKITVDFLQDTLMDHQQNVEELALSEIHSIQLVMPKFNSLGSLNKYEFNKLLSLINKGKLWGSRKDNILAFTVIIAAISDTFTCMIQNNQFYDNFLGDNSQGLKLMVELVNNMKNLFVTYHRAIETKQLETLIDILEKSAERIKTEKVYYEIMQQNISSLRNLFENQLDKENKTEIPEPNTKFQIEDKTDPILMEEIKFPLVSTNNNKLHNSIKSKDCIEKKNSLIKTMQEKFTPVVPLKSQISNKKPANAFELMMMSSKKLSLKRKQPV